MQLHTTLQQVDESTINMMRRWYSMWERCYLPSGQGYEYYGARGICVCQEWLDFQAFYNFWGDPLFEGATIGRIDNDGNYEPNNCRWATDLQQMRNKRGLRLITIDNQTKCLTEWAEHLNLDINDVNRDLYERKIDVITVLRGGDKK